MASVFQFLPILARVLIGSYFLFFGLWNIYHWTPVLKVMMEDNIPCPWLALQVGILFQVVAGGMIATGMFVEMTAAVLIPLMVMAAFIFHPFWKRRGELFRLHFVLFMATLTISLGALLLLIAHPG